MHWNKKGPHLKDLYGNVIPSLVRIIYQIWINLNFSGKYSHLEIIMKSLLHSGPLCLEIGITRRSCVQENQDSFQHLEIKRPLRGLRKPKVTQLLIPPNCQGRAVRSHKYSYEKTCRDRDKGLMFFPKKKNIPFHGIWGLCWYIGPLFQ